VLMLSSLLPKRWDFSSDMSEGIKFDGGKIRYDLLSPEFLEETAKVLTFGAQKYGDRNWELGMDWHRPFGALMRHLWSWWRGEDYDQESGLHHLSHAACNLQFLVTYAIRNKGRDTRPDYT
jgi:hypothetical protein